MRNRSALLAVALLPIAGCGDAVLDAVGLPPRVLADGLVAHWALDEGGGNSAGDSSGNGQDGQLTGGTWITDGRFGGGLRLVAGDAVSVQGFPAATSNWSVALWIRMSDEQLAFNSNDPFTEILSTENIGSAGWQINIDKRLAEPRFVFSYWAPPLMGYVGTECSCVTPARGSTSRRPSTSTPIASRSTATGSSRIKRPGRRTSSLAIRRSISEVGTWATAS